tara:strand:- start:13 stop:594 length:582 start_codon:yes stop_codon:yes gene_type:complete
MKKLLAYLLIPFTLCADLVLLDTLDFDIDDSLSFTRNHRTETGHDYYYNLLSFTVDTQGEYRADNTLITSHSTHDYGENHTGLFNRADTFIYLYENSFDPEQPSLNLLAFDDDGYDGQNDNGVQFSLSHTLQPDTTYYSVITTYNAEQQIAGEVEIYGPNGASWAYTIIPEPATYGLIMGGALLILLKRKRNV